ncbi:hypothetical protein QJQ45_019152 [Haematococcus lacustris]|nr:hypothetical protein QJQ45_019152 [Haematococcus lacustris]
MRSRHAQLRQSGAVVRTSVALAARMQPPVPLWRARESSGSKAAVSSKSLSAAEHREGPEVVCLVFDQAIQKMGHRATDECASLRLPPVTQVASKVSLLCLNTSIPAPHHIHLAASVVAWLSVWRSSGAGCQPGSVVVLAAAAKLRAVSGKAAIRERLAGEEWEGRAEEGRGGEGRPRAHPCVHAGCCCLAINQAAVPEELARLPRLHPGTPLLDPLLASLTHSLEVTGLPALCLLCPEHKPSALTRSLSDSQASVLALHQALSAAGLLAGALCPSDEVEQLVLLHRWFVPQAAVGGDLMYC